MGRGLRSGWQPLIALEQQHIGALIGEVAGLTVADVGCGTGRHAIQLAAAGARVVALDFSPGMLAAARAKPGAERVQFLLHDVTTPLPFEEGDIDRVICCLVLDHVGDLRGLLGELARMCAPPPRGAIVISTMHPAMTERGVQARFYDPRTGEQVQPASQTHTISDYVRAALDAGLAVERLEEHTVGESLAAACPRGARYIGWPMLLLTKLSRSGGEGTTWPSGRP